MARHVVRSALYNKLRWLTLPRNPLAFEGFYMREWFDQICILEKNSLMISWKINWKGKTGIRKDNVKLLL